MAGTAPNEPTAATAEGPGLPPGLTLQDLERRILDALPTIERWFRMQWQDHTPPFYGSVDLRNAGYKLAPVDMKRPVRGSNQASEPAPRLPGIAG